MYIWKEEIRICKGGGGLWWGGKVEGCGRVLLGWIEKGKVAGYDVNGERDVEVEEDGGGFYSGGRKGW